MSSLAFCMFSETNKFIESLPIKYLVLVGLYFTPGYHVDTISLAHLV